MARYYFHFKNGVELIKDEEGSELPTLDEARLQALKAGRELWADSIKAGKPLGVDAIVIADEQGQILPSSRFPKLWHFPIPPMTEVNVTIRQIEFELEKAEHGMALPYDAERVGQLRGMLRDALKRKLSAGLKARREQTAR